MGNHYLVKLKLIHNADKTEELTLLADYSNEDYTITLPSNLETIEDVIDGFRNSSFFVDQQWADRFENFMKIGNLTIAKIKSPVETLTRYAVLASFKNYEDELMWMLSK